MKYLKIIYYIWQLQKHFVVHQNKILTQAQKSFENNEIEKCIHIIEMHMQINYLVYLIKPDEGGNDLCSKQKNALACIGLHLNKRSSDLNCAYLFLSTRLLNSDVLTFIRCIAHEMAHIAIHKCYPLERYHNNEIATDLLVMLFGLNSYVFQTKSGYLTTKQKLLAYYFLRILQLKNKISIT